MVTTSVLDVFHCKDIENNKTKNGVCGKKWMFRTT